VDVGDIVRNNDIEAIQEHLADVTYSNLNESELDDIPNKKSNFMKLFQMTQLTSEYLLDQQATLGDESAELEKEKGGLEAESAQLEQDVGAQSREIQRLKAQVQNNSKMLAGYEGALTNPTKGYDEETEEDDDTGRRHRHSSSSRHRSRGRDRELRSRRHKYSMDEYITIHIAAPNGREIKIKAPPDATIAALKHKACKRFAHVMPAPVERLSFVFKGGALREADTVEECDVMDRDTIYAVAIHSQGQGEVDSAAMSALAAVQAMSTQMMAFAAGMQQRQPPSRQQPVSKKESAHNRALQERLAELEGQLAQMQEGQAQLAEAKRRKEQEEKKLQLGDMSDDLGASHKPANAAAMSARRHSLASNLLRVEVVDAIDLASAEWTRAGKSDPYCELRLNGKPLPHKYKTKTISNNNSPKWTHEFFDVLLPSEVSEALACTLHICVWDHATLGSRTFLGEVVFTGEQLCMLPTGSAERIQHPLVAQPGKSQKHVHGQLGLRMYVPELVQLKVVSASGLPRMDGMTSGSKSDPYCKVLLDGQLQHTTMVVANNLNPVWDATNEQVTLVLPSLPEISTSEPTIQPSKKGGKGGPTGELRVEVWDRDNGVMDGSDDFIGVVRVSLEDLHELPFEPPADVPKKHSMAREFPIDASRGRGKAKNHGQLSLELCRKRPDAALIAGTQAAQEAEEVNMKRAKGKGTSRMRPANVVHVDVLRAVGLSNADGWYGKSDPYCKVYLAGKLVHRTKTVSNNNNPEWTEALHCGCEIVLPSSLASAQGCILRLEVWDKDVGSDEFLGHVEIPGTELCALGSTSANDEMRRYPLGPADDKNNKFVGGELWVQLYLPEVCVITTVSATGLAKMDLVGHSDPYCKIVSLSKAQWAVIKGCEPMQKVSYDEKARTCAIANTGEPVWEHVHNNTFYLVRRNRAQESSQSAGNEEHGVCVEVWDADKLSSDDFMGQIVLALREIDELPYEGKQRLDTMQRPLAIRKNQKKVQGSVGLQLYKLRPELVFEGQEAVHEESARGMLHNLVRLQIVNAQGLVSADTARFSRKAVPSDPYVLVYVNGADKPLHKTKVIHNCNDPVWSKEVVDVPLPDDEASQLASSIRLEVWDHDGHMGGKGTFLGEVTLKGDQIVSPSSVAGTSATPLPGMDSTTQYALTEQAKDPSKKTSDKQHTKHNKHVGGTLGLRVYAPDVLTLSINYAKHLRNADIGGKSDPYCVVIFNGEPLVLHADKKGKKARRTSVVKNNLDPVWQNEVLSFPLPADVYSCKMAALRVEVWDQDHIGSDDFLGEVAIDGNQLASLPPYAEGDGLTFSSDVEYKLTERGGAPARAKGGMKSKAEAVIGLGLSLRRPSKGGGDVEAARSTSTGAPAAAHAAEVVGNRDAAPIRSIKVDVVRALDLAKTDHFGGKSDPFCVLLLNGKKVGETPTVKNSVNPSWEALAMQEGKGSFTIALPRDPASVLASRLVVQLWDRDVTKKHSAFLGQAVIAGDELAKLPSSADPESLLTVARKLERDPWAKAGAKQTKHVRGSLLLKMYTPDVMHLRLVKANELKAGAKCDGYTQVTLTHKLPEANGKCKPTVLWQQQSNVIKNNANPVWGGAGWGSKGAAAAGVFAILLPEERRLRECELVMEVLDKNMMNDGSQGQVTLTGDELLQLQLGSAVDEPEPFTRPLLPKAKGPSNSTLCFSVRKLRPMAVESATKQLLESGPALLPNTVRVRIVSAEGIAKADKGAKKHADAYVQLVLNGQAVEGACTKVVSNNANPQWGEALDVVLPADVDGVQMSSLELQMFDHDPGMLGSSKQFMGQVAIPGANLCSLPPAAAPMLLGGGQLAIAASTNPKMKIQTIGGAISGTMRVELSVPTVLHVDVIGALGVGQLNTDWYSKSDPYVKLVWRGKELTHRTMPISNNHSPVWDLSTGSVFAPIVLPSETELAALAAASNTTGSGATSLDESNYALLRVQLWDKDTLSADDFLGEVAISAADILALPTHSMDDDHMRPAAMERPLCKKMPAKMKIKAGAAPQATLITGRGGAAQPAFKFVLTKMQPRSVAERDQAYREGAADKDGIHFLPLDSGLSVAREPVVLATTKAEAKAKAVSGTTMPDVTSEQDGELVVRVDSLCAKRLLSQLNPKTKPFKGGPTVRVFLNNTFLGATAHVEAAGDTNDWGGLFFPATGKGLAVAKKRVPMDVRLAADAATRRASELCFEVWHAGGKECLGRLVLSGEQLVEPQLPHAQLGASDIGLVSCPLAMPQGLEASAQSLGELAMRLYVPVKLQIHIVGGDHLPPADSNGLSDPYCKLFFAGRQLSERGGITRVLNKTLHPVWQGECFEITLPAPLVAVTTAKEDGLLKVEVWDKDGGFMHGGSDDLLGEVYVDLSSAESVSQVGLGVDSNGNAKAKLTLRIAGGAEAKRQALAAKKKIQVTQGTLTLRLEYTRSAVDPARVLGRALMNNWQTSGFTMVYFDIRIPNAPAVLRLGVKIKPTMLVSDVCALVAKQLEPKYVQYAGRLCLFDKSTKEPLPAEQRIYPELHSGRDLALMINANDGNESAYLDAAAGGAEPKPKEHFEQLIERLRQFYTEPTRAAECTRQLPQVTAIVEMVGGNEAVLNELLRMKYDADLSSMQEAQEPTTSYTREDEEEEKEEQDTNTQTATRGDREGAIAASKVVAEMEMHTRSAKRHLGEQFAKDGGVGKKGKRYLDIYVAASDVMVAAMAVDERNKSGKKAKVKGKTGPSNVYAKMWIVDSKKKMKKGGSKAKTRLQKAQAEEVVGWDDAQMDRLRLTCDSTDLSNGGMLRLKIKKKGGCCGGSKTIAEQDFPLSNFGMIGSTNQAGEPASMNVQLPHAQLKAKMKAGGKPVTVGLVYTHPGPKPASAEATPQAARS
jgi:Ca2+-dependent lipid-binding protein